MLNYIEFHGDLFNHDDYYNLVDEMTNNMIFICDCPQTKNKIVNEIEKICNGECVEYGHDYWCGENRLYPTITKRVITYLPTTRLVIDNEQTITCTIEAPFVLTATDIKDIWFAVNNGGKISVYPMTIFKGSHDKWNDGIESVYCYVTGGRYGSYDGYWMNKNSLKDTVTSGWMTKEGFILNNERERN